MDKIYTNPLGVTSQFYFCGVPFRLDSYQGCSHRCHYCFANKAFGGIRSSGIADREAEILPADVESIRQDFEKAFSGDIGIDLRRQFLQRRIPIHWGGMSEPFQPIELKYKVSLKLLDLFTKYQYPVVCSTKGVLLARPEYLCRAIDANLAVQVTLLTLDDRIRQGLEPYASTVEERLALIETLSNAGLWVAVRLQPLIVDTAIERDANKLIDEVANRGAKHLIVEAYKPPLDNKGGIRATGDAFGISILHLYQRYCGTSYRREIELPTWRKYQYLVPLREKCHQVGMTYGAADNQLHEEGDTICCCGIDNLQGFENFWRYQSVQAASIAKKKGVVAMSDLQKEWCPTGRFGANENWWRDHGDDHSLKGYFGWKWREGGPDSPEDLAHLERSWENNEVVYRWVNNPSVLHRGIVQSTMF